VVRDSCMPSSACRRFGLGRQTIAFPTDNPNQPWKRMRFLNFIAYFMFGSHSMSGFGACCVTHDVLVGGVCTSDLHTIETPKRTSSRYFERCIRANRQTRRYIIRQAHRALHWSGTLLSPFRHPDMCPKESQSITPIRRISNKGLAQNR
jgi:hypothetical protein